MYVYMCADIVRCVGKVIWETFGVVVGNIEWVTGWSKVRVSGGWMDEGRRKEWMTKVEKERGKGKGDRDEW